MLLCWCDDEGPWGLGYAAAPANDDTGTAAAALRPGGRTSRVGWHQNPANFPEYGTIPVADEVIGDTDFHGRHENQLEIVSESC